MPQNQFSKNQVRLLTDIGERGQSLKKLSDGQLVSMVESLRSEVISKPQVSKALIPQVLALSKEAVCRTLGWELYDVQLLAAHALIEGHVAEMQTGEGKTIAAVPAAIFGGMQGRGAHVATPTPYLARRDYLQLKPVYESLGLSVGLLVEPTGQGAGKTDAYECDITYGPGYEFGFDYLRDQVALKQSELAPLGKQIIAGLTGGSPQPMRLCARGPCFSIVDEADNVLIDDASSPLVLSEFQPGVAPDADAIHLAKNLVVKLVPLEHFRELGPLHIELTEQGRSFVYRDEVKIPVDQLSRPWTNYVEAALQAAKLFRRDVHYIVDDGKVKIVDATTGRIFEDRAWQAGLHQAIEAKEGLQVTPEKLPLAQITRQRFHRLYGALSGMTGTAMNCRDEFKSVYQLGITAIPLRIPSQRKILPMRAFDGAEQKWDAIAESIKEFHRQQRPVLIGTRTISESEDLADRLQSAGLPYQLLNGKQDAEEAEIVSQAGQRGALTIATNLAGRGTDIKLGKGVSELGGIHVIVSECHDSSRVDRQLVGRCARQGNPGSAQTFVSVEDWLVQVHGLWLAHAVKKMSTQGELDFSLESRIQKIQNSVERTNYSHRLELLRASEQYDDVLQRQR